MRSFAWIAAALAITVGCTSNSEEPQDPPTQSGLSGALEGAPSGALGGESQTPSAACAMPSAPGTILQRVQLPPSAVGAVLAADAAGGVAFTNNTGSGVTRLDAQLAPVYTYPFGDVVALDAAGNAYVAGGFTAATDFGTGSIAPNGNVDTFLVKLSPTGEVLSARALDLCGDGVQDIAVGADGRIALSGTAIGTVVLDASGAIAYQLAASGKVAFDSRGDLVLGGTFTGSVTLGGTVLSAGAATDTDGFLAVFDAAGNAKLARHYGDTQLPIMVGGFGGFVDITTPQFQGIADVAVGPHDEIVASGAFRGEIDVNGATHVNSFSFPSGSEAGTFVVSLAADGSDRLAFSGASANAGIGIGGLRSTLGLLNPGTAIAVNGNGAIAVSANTPGDAQFPFAFPQLTGYDSITGAVGASLGNETGFSGYGLGVAIDACGNAIWASLENDPSLNFQHTFLTRVAL